MYLCLCSGFPGPCQPDNIVRTCLDTDAATGAELTFEIEDDRFSVLDFVDLVLGGRIHGVKLQCVHRARNNTIVTAGTMFHVNVHCKCHDFTHQL